MFQMRLERPRPQRDDKVLTAWNGLMIAACARAARAIPSGQAEGAASRQAYLEAARRAAGFLQEHMWNGGTGTLLRSFRQGRGEIEGYAEDFAFLIFGLLELFQTDPDVRWLSWAVALQRRQDELFWDEADGGWFSTTGRDPSVLLRLKEDYDGAEPSASSVSVWNLIVLTHFVEDPRWPDRVERTLRLFGVRLDRVGRSVPMMAAALSAYTAGPLQVVIVGDPGGDAMARALAGRYLPFATVLRVSAGQQAALAVVAPFLAAMQPVDGRAAAYVCRNFTCRPPVTTVDALDRELGGAP
jgi:uncharacterized protein YyaL (SSP411 family)